MMSVLCKGCKKTEKHNDIGLKTNGSQYKTCMQCRNKELKEEPQEELPNCCDAEGIRNTFKTVNCEIVYASELKCMLALDRGIAQAIFAGVIKTQSFVIVETITLPNFVPLWIYLYI